MITPQKKKEILKKYNLHEKDTGSSEIQIALLSENIKNLVSHLKEHPKDFHSKRGLLKMIAKRKKFLNLLKKKYTKRYDIFIEKLKEQNKDNNNNDNE